MHDSSTQPHPTPSALIVAPAPAGPRASSPPRRPCESRDPAPDARKCDRTAYEKVSSLTRTHVFSDFAAARSDAFACVSVGSATPSHSPSTACVAARASPRAPLVAKSSSGLRLPAETLPGRRPASPSGYGGGSGESKSKSKSDEPMVRYRFAGELGRWAPACAGATSRWRRRYVRERGVGGGAGMCVATSRRGAATTRDAIAFLTCSLSVR